MYSRWFHRCFAVVSPSAGRFAKTRPLCALPAVTRTQVTPFRLYGSGESSLQSSEVASKLQSLMEAFGEARELIDEAKESAGTRYFEEDIKDAQEQTKLTLQLWEDIKAHVISVGDTETLERLRKEHELKMAQLSAELEDAEHAGGGDD